MSMLGRDSRNCRRVCLDDEQASTFVLIFFSRAFCFRRWVRRTKATCRGAGDLDGTDLGFGIALDEIEKQYVELGVAL
jgi:hypothetical protein